MTTKNPCRLIRCKNARTGQGSTPYHHARAVPYNLPCSTQEDDKLYPGTYNAGRDFDNQLRSHEILARGQYAKLLDALSLECQPGWFDKMLNRHILPTLNRIGLDKTISKGIFDIASSSWCRMGPPNDKIIAIHPKINQEIEEVRRGLELTVGSEDDTLSRLPSASSAIFSGTINENQSPVNLLALLDNIVTPWIVLPRALLFLEKDHCRYLSAYLTTIEREKREAILILFGRITVEFVGNFSLKFATMDHQPEKIAKLLFYGYASLFWKTLRCPPENLENSAAFDIFFNWINRLVRTNGYLGYAELKSIEQMKKMKMTTFPTQIVNPSRQPDRNNSSRLLITLRHGCMGKAAALKYFGIDQFSAARQIAGRFQSPSYQNDLQGLLNTIQQNCHLESKRTRVYIHQFIGNLRSAYVRWQRHFHPTTWNFLIRKINNIQILLNS